LAAGWSVMANRYGWPFNVNDPRTRNLDDMKQIGIGSIRVSAIGKFH
jgi:hypothetical protein